MKLLSKIQRITKVNFPNVIFPLVTWKYNLIFQALKSGKKLLFLYFLNVTESIGTLKGTIFFFILGQDYFRVIFAQNRVSE